MCDTPGIMWCERIRSPIVNTLLTRVSPTGKTVQVGSSED
jgi:hypothetical protein